MSMNSLWLLNRKHATEEDVQKALHDAIELTRKEEQDLGSLRQSPNTLSPEQEAEYRKLAIQMLDAFGDKLFGLLLNALGGYKRLLNTAADGIWLGMRHEVKKFPPELLAMLKPYSGTDRIQKFVLSIAPHFLMQTPIETIEDTLSQLKPFLEHMKQIEEMNKEVK